jgi:hypothetical protein
MKDHENLNQVIACEGANTSRLEISFEIETL